MLKSKFIDYWWSISFWIINIFIKRLSYLLFLGFCKENVFGSVVMIKWKLVIRRFEEIFKIC